MRALGPGSVSSLLKMALDVVYWAIWGVLGLSSLASMALLVFPGLMDTYADRLVLQMGMVEGARVPTAAVVLMLIAFSLSLLGYAFIVGVLRRIFNSLSLGDPFHPDNVRRLRMIGLALLCVESFAIVVRILREKIWHLNFESQASGRDVSGWFSVLVIFVLAEVFREGARLRREADLTI